MNYRELNWNGNSIARLSSVVFVSLLFFALVVSQQISLILAILFLSVVIILASFNGYDQCFLFLALSLPFLPFAERVAFFLSGQVAERNFVLISQQLGIIILLIGFVLGKRVRLRARNSLDTLMIGFCAIIAFSVVWGIGNASVVLGGVQTWVLPVGIYLVGRNFFGEPANNQKMLTVLLVVGLLYNLYAIFQSVFDLNAIDYYWLSRRTSFLDQQGQLGEGSFFIDGKLRIFSFGAFPGDLQIISTTSALIGIFLTLPNKRLLWIRLLNLLTFVVVAILSLERSMLVMVAVGGMVGAAIRYRRHLKRLLLISSALFVLVLSVAFAISRFYDLETDTRMIRLAQIFNPLDEEKGSTILWRVMLWSSTLDHIMTHPLGEGIGSATAKSGDLKYEGGEFGYIHSTYLGLTIELGWAGGICFVIMIVLAFLVAWDKAKRGYHESSIVCLSVWVSIVVALAINGIVNNTLIGYYGFIFWSAISGIAALQTNKGDALIG